MLYVCLSSLRYSNFYHPILNRTTWVVLWIVHSVFFSLNHSTFYYQSDNKIPRVAHLTFFFFGFIMALAFNMLPIYCKCSKELKSAFQLKASRNEIHYTFSLLAARQSFLSRNWVKTHTINTVLPNHTSFSTIAFISAANWDLGMACVTEFEKQRSHHQNNRILTSNKLQKC